MEDILPNQDLRLFFKYSLNKLKIGIYRFSTLPIVVKALILASDALFSPKMGSQAIFEKIVEIS
jgi:hypothetical protein